MKLIYINCKESNYEGKNEYEFLFSNYPDDSWGPGWDTFFPDPPEECYIHDVLLIKEESLNLSVLQDLNMFTMTDAMDKIIALAWEEDDVIKKIDGERLVFNYGENKLEVLQKLKKRNYLLL